MIAAHIDHNSPKEALHLFSQMIMQVQMQQPRQRAVQYQNLKLMMNMSTPSVLRACIYTEDFGLGKQVHGLVFKLGHSEDIITCRYFMVVIELFKKMSRAGVKRNGFTISNVLRTCGRFSRGADDYEKNDDDRGLSGKQVHGACQHHQTWSGRI
ncbi:hypothetical protein MKX01_000292 [Papaver californicum]|nr:hypothetical protein MKX01_000292 [Papaver californicum]